MTESKARLVDAVCKIVATFALVVGGGWTLFTYFTTRASEARTASIEARKPFLAKRLEVYAETVDLSAKITSNILKYEADRNISSDTGPRGKEMGIREEMNSLGDEQRKLERQFLALSAGPMQLVEDQYVQQTLKELTACFKSSNCGGKAALEITQNFAHACRDSVNAEWQLDALTKVNFENQRN